MTETKVWNIPWKNKRARLLLKKYNYSGNFTIKNERRFEVGIIPCQNEEPFTEEERPLPEDIASSLMKCLWDLSDEVDEFIEKK